MDGIINLLKCTGMTSSDAVVRVRRILGEKRIGHGGTLDPAAAGVLPLLVGRATKLFDEVTGKKKTYIAEFVFGTGTDTLDGDGTIDSVIRPSFTGSDLQQALGSFTGNISQRPPMYSAIKIGGRKLVDLARKGKHEQVPERNITVSAFEVLRQTGPHQYMMKITCSSGTYIRSLCRDLARNLNTCGYVSYLLRSQAGPYLIQDSVSLEQLEFNWRNDPAGLIRPPDEPLKHLLAVHLSPDDERKVRNGQSIVPADQSLGKGTVRLYAGQRFLGTGILRNSGSGICLKMKTMLERRET